MPLPAAAPDPGAADGSTPGALSQLILDENYVTQSYQRMADRSWDEKTQRRLVSKQYLQKLAETPPKNPPGEEKLQGIALAVRKPLVVVQEAAAEQWLGYKAREVSGYGQRQRLVIAYMDEMTPEEVDHWLTLMQASTQAKRKER